MIQITLTNTGVHAALASLLQRIDHPQVGYFNPHPARRPGESRHGQAVPRLGGADAGSCRAGATASAGPARRARDAPQGVPGDGNVRRRPDLQDIGRAVGLSRSTVSLVLCGKYQFSLGAGAPECSRELIAAVAARHLALEQARLAAVQERTAQRYLSTAHNQALADALELVGRQLQQAPLLAGWRAERRGMMAASVIPFPVRRPAARRRSCAACAAPSGF